MLSNSTEQLPLTTQYKPILKAPRKVSDAQTNTSSNNSSFSSLSSSPLSPFTESELILLKIYSTQTPIPKYYDESNPKPKNFYYLSRKKIFTWVNDVLSSTSLPQIKQHSIYHRFTYAYSLTTSSFYNKNIFYSKDKFKILAVAIFLICYKMEGFTISKLTIPSIVNSFLKTVQMNITDIIHEIQKIEIEICKLFDYDIYLFENNQFQISLIILELLKEKFGFEDEYYKTVYDVVDMVNRHVDSSSNNEVNFGLMPIEKGMIGVFGAIIKLNNEKLSEEILEYIDYFYNELNVVRCSFQERDLITFSKHYMRKINIEKRK